ncbi:CbtA family protein [Streptomyces sp.]|uniref:CbtA family protein n=1 Tax=Streptomyces sp. TaxID=1931 RepID=UPI002F3FA1FF
MEKRLILRGVLAGAVAGFLAFVFARIFAEPQISRAIGYESGRDAAQAALDKAAGLPAEAAGAELFSRSVQADAGLGVGLVLFGTAMGAMFAVVYAVYLGRVGGLRPRSLALLVAGGGFLGLYLVPFLKYPASPPAIGHEDTIGARTGLYLIMVVCSLLFLGLAVWLGQRLRSRFGNWNATLLAAGAFVVAVGVVMALLPAVGQLAYNKEHFGRHTTETPLPLTDDGGRIVYPGFPADVLFSFRVYSVAAQLLLWSVLGLVFAPLAERALGQRAGATGAATRVGPVGA